MNPMEKIASLPASEQIQMISDGLDKMAAERDRLSQENQKLASDLALEKFCTQVMDSGQSPWASRDDALVGLRKLATEGRLDAFKVSLDLLPGTLPKLASGLDSVTDVEDGSGKRVANVKESRARVINAVLGSVADD